MGRHRKMAAGHVGPEPKPAVQAGVQAGGQQPPGGGVGLLTASAADDEPWRPTVTPEQQPLYEELLGYRPRIAVKGLSTLVPIAAAMVVQDPARTRETDRKGLTLLCQLLAYDRDLYGHVDLRRALERVHVDHYVRSGAGGQTIGTARAYSSHFYRFGRILHPTQYPAPREGINRTRVQPPYSPSDIEKLYSRHLSLTDRMGDRLFTVLDLATGVGARSSEMSRLTGSSVRQIRIPGGGVAVCVDLVSRRTGVIRTVPVVGASKAARLWRRANAAGPDGYLLEGFRRNSVNGIQRAIRRRGVDIEISAVRLRHAWIVDMAHRRIPIAMFLELADLGDSHSLHELTMHMRGYDPTETAAVVTGALR